MNIPHLLAAVLLVVSAHTHAGGFAEILITNIRTGLDFNGQTTVFSDVDASHVFRTTGGESFVSGTGVNVVAPDVQIGHLYWADFSYTITVSDDGLPASAQRYCQPASQALCVATDGHEISFAQLRVNYNDGRQDQFFRRRGGDSPTLQTHADGEAELLTLSGVARGSIEIMHINPLGQPENLFDSIFAITYLSALNDGVSPVPEPSTYLLIAVGLMLIVMAARRS